MRIMACLPAETVAPNQAPRNGLNQIRTRRRCRYKTRTISLRGFDPTVEESLEQRPGTRVSAIEAHETGKVRFIRPPAYIHSFESANLIAVNPIPITYYAVIEFKVHRADVYYFHRSESMNITIDSYVMVDADRGQDLGKAVFITEILSEAFEVKRTFSRENYNTLLKVSRIGRPPGWNSEQSFNSYHDFNTNCSFAGGFIPGEGHSSVTKAIKRLALDKEIEQLEYKTEREEAAKRLCVLAVQRHGLHLHEMEILEAEFQQ